MQNSYKPLKTCSNVSMMLVMSTAMMLLTACEKATSSVYVSSCLPLASYTKTQQSEVANAMEAHPHAAWAQMIEDYGKLRKQVKAVCDAKD